MTETSVQNTPINEAAETARTYNPGTICHIVMFKYKDDITAAQKQNVITAFLALKDNCKRNGTAYIRDIEYGFPSSKEGKDQNMEVAFFVTFDSEGDRNYYTGTPYINNPVYYESKHAEFKAMVGPLLAKNLGVIVYDYKKLP